MSLLPGGPWSSFVRAAGVFGAPLLIVGGTQTFTASGSYPVPSTAAYARVQGWGPGNNGAASVSGSHSGGAGGGGEYAEEPQLLAAGDTLTVTISAGAATTVTGGPVTVTANPGGAASGQTGGSPGTGSTNTIHHDGGQGGSGLVGTNRGGAGGGSSAGPSAPGNNGSAGGVGTFGSGATAPTGGGNGGNGGSPSTSGVAGQAPGGGGGGGGDGALHGGGSGAGGQAIITWYYYSAVGAPVSARGRAGIMPATRSQGSAGAPVYSVTPGMVAPFASPRKASAGRSGARTGRAQSSAGVPPVPVVPGPPAVFTPPSSAPRVRRGARTGRAQSSKGAPVIPVPVLVVNQWAATFAQPAAFQTTPPALQSTVVALTPAASVGGGTGTPSAGNWLFMIAGWNQAGLPGAAAGAADDIHSFWRPGDVTTSTWASSPKTGKTRTAIWYTPNLARAAGDVYAAPSGAVAGMACTVFEVSGLGPWDTVTGISSNYAAAVTSLNLALGAPSGQAFLLAAVCGDNSAAGQALSPAGWSTLAPVTASGGADHSCDAVLTAACLTTSGSVSVNATAVSAQDMSGVIIGVLKTAPSPLTGTGISPGWAGRMIYEFAPGGGFGTPQDELTWVTLSDSAAPRGTTKRAWAWNDRGGVPYSLGQLQSGGGNCQLDNADGYLTPSNSTTSPWYPDVVTGTPVRVRAALGTVAGTPVNRWYVIQRHALNWDEKRTTTLRNYVDAGLTDIWSVVAGSCPTPYRGEIRQDSPYAWWPMDDQPLSGGVQPVSLLNAAAGNTKTLSIIPASGGVAAADAYSTSGADLTATGTSSTTPPFPGVATYAVAQQAGWMYGDPQASPASYQTSNPVTASPGSAAWQQSGMQGADGKAGWFLTCNDTSFPPLSGGVTVKGWFNAAFFGTATGYTAPSLARYVVAGQPYAPVTLCTLSTNSAPVAELQLDLSGHLNLITFSGTTPASSTIYSASDLRSGSWHCVDITLTATTWSVMVDGGLTASASGTAAGMTSAWSWLTLNGDYGNTAGGSSPASLQHGGNVAYSHWAVFGAAVPAWRLRAHYAAAITGFGLLPAPQTVSLSKVANKLAGSGYVPDGSVFQGSYGIPSSGAVGGYIFSGLAVAVAGLYTSGPSARAVSAGYGTDSGGVFYGDAQWLSWTSLSPSVAVYTGSSASGETNAATVAGSGDSFTAGYGAGAAGAGVCQAAAGTGASPPSAPSSLGDTVQGRIERILGYGGNACPRAIDPASLLVAAATDTGGQSAGSGINNIVQSDNGLLATGNGGELFYRQRSHLAADTVVWNLSSAGPSSGIPFDASQEFPNDPQRVWNAITVSQFSPDGASLPVTVPSDATAAHASQDQYGVQPKQVTSYLQDPARLQSQADWLLAQYGALHRRVTGLKADAAKHPAAWPLVLACNPGDLVQITDQPVQGGPRTTGTYRVSSVSRKIAFGANGNAPEASVTLTCDFEPSSWWS